MAKPQQTVKVEQKIYRLYDNDVDSINNELKKGWVIKQISSTSTQYSTYCYVLLEKIITE